MRSRFKLMHPHALPACMRACVRGVAASIVALARAQRYVVQDGNDFEGHVDDAGLEQEAERLLVGLGH